MCALLLQFVVFGSALAFSYAAVRTNIETEYWTRRLTASSFVWSTQAMTSVDLKRAQNAEVIKVRLRPLPCVVCTSTHTRTDHND